MTVKVIWFILKDGAEYGPFEKEDFEKIITEDKFKIKITW